MASEIVVPFNFRPVSTTLGGGSSYTVPAGMYALITPLYADYSINSVFINPSLLVGSGGTGTATLNLIPYQPYTFAWSLLGSGTDYYIVAGGHYGRHGGAGSSSSGSAVILPSTTGSQVQVSYSGTINEGEFWLYQWPPLNMQPFWVKAGDVIGGYRYLVTLYNQIT